ncbi:GldG family protein [Candidatus Woesebacteria bacterium]|nr:GldG family protein [Candidatus Woesebacteria bacterium]
MKKFVGTLKQKTAFLGKLKDVNLVKRFNLERFQKGTLVLMSIVVFLALNLLFSYISLRLDLSKGKAYTLSSSTKKMVQKLEKPVNVTLYSSDNIPARLQPLKREVLDLLREYDRASGNVTLQIWEFNPTEDQQTLQTIQQAGITGLPIREQQQSEVSVTEIYFGIIVKYEKNQEVIPQALDVENLEYNLTSAMYRLTNTTLPLISTIGSSPSQMQQQDPLGMFRQVLGGLFRVQDVLSQPSEDDPEKSVLTIDPETKTLVVVDSMNLDFTEEELSAISSYAEKGNAVIFTDGVTVDGNTLETASGEAKLHEIIAQKGITVQPNLVLSSQSEVVNLGGNGFSLMVPYPLWVVTSEFATDASYFSGIGRLTMPWTSSLELREVQGYTTKKLIQTSGESWSQKGTFSLNPQQIPQPSQSDLEELTLAAESVAKDGHKLMVVGTSRLIDSQFQSRDSQNIEFMINVLSDYASDGALSGIGRRIISLYPLPNLQKSVQEAYKYSNILALPLMFGAYGLYRMLQRK